MVKSRVFMNKLD